MIVLLFDSTGNLRASVVTDENGRYSFNSLDHSVRPGESLVVSVRYTQESLAQLQGTVKTVGSNGAIDSNGAQNELREAMEATIVVGAYGSIDQSIDFG